MTGNPQPTTLMAMQIIEGRAAKTPPSFGKREVSESRPKMGRPTNKEVDKIVREENCSRQWARHILRERTQRQALRNRTLRERLLDETAQRRFCPLIKSTDNWDIATVHYQRTDDGPGYGIPGDLYAHCLYYFARSGDLVVAPMAGSGMIRRAYLDRALWTKGLPQPWDIELRMFDLTPRGPYKALIGQYDLRTGFPDVGRAADYVILDLPYLGVSRGRYSRKAEDMANMGEAQWKEAVHAIARICAKAGVRRHCPRVGGQVEDAVAARELSEDRHRRLGSRRLPLALHLLRFPPHPTVRWAVDEAVECEGKGVPCPVVRHRRGADIRPGRLGVRQPE
jgi:hypothetical protein